MRLKQYLRGLGIGIIVTAIIIGVSSFNQSNRLTNEEIKEKASELGMVEGTLEESEEMLPLDSSKEMPKEVKEDGTILDQVQEDGLIAPVETTEEDILAEEELQADDSKKEEEIVQNLAFLTIESGDSSYAVASELERLLVIDNAYELDEYLCVNEYSKKIRIGVYEIPVDSTYEQIAKIICGNE